MKSYSQHTAKDLLALVKAGDEAAFEAAYTRFRPFALRYALRITRSQEAAEEIVQNVMLKMWLNRGELDPELNFKGWIAKVSAREAFDFLKRLSKEKALAEKVWLNMQAVPAYAEEEYVMKDYLSLVADAIRSLPAQQQKVYRMSREQYLTYEQIGEELGISANTVRNHMAGALDNIRKFLAQEAVHTLPPALAFLIFFGGK